MQKKRGVLQEVCHHCVLLPIVHYIMRSVSRCQAVHHELLLPACCLVANIPAFMGHGTWDMGHSSIISLCRVEQSGGEWSGVDSEDAVISHQHITDTGLEHRRGMGSRVRCRLSLQAMNMNKEWKQQA